MPGDATKVDEVTHEGNRSRTRLWVGMILLGALVALLAAVAVACGEAVTETTVPPATDATTTAVTPASTSTTLADVSPPSGADAVIAYLSAQHAAGAGVWLATYHSGAEVRWILDNVEGAREKAEAKLFELRKISEEAGKPQK